MTLSVADRREVFARDGGCVATQTRWFGTDVAPDLCRDGWGGPIFWNQLERMEWDHVTDDGGIRRDDPAHGVTVCPWHHRLSREWRVDSSRHRAQIRAKLRVMYPKDWHASP